MAGVAAGHEPALHEFVDRFERRVYGAAIAIHAVDARWQTRSRRTRSCALATRGVVRSTRNRHRLGDADHAHIAVDALRVRRPTAVDPMDLVGVHDEAPGPASVNRVTTRGARAARHVAAGAGPRPAHGGLLWIHRSGDRRDGGCPPRHRQDPYPARARQAPHRIARTGRGASMNSLSCAEVRESLLPSSPSMLDGDQRCGGAGPSRQLRQLPGRGRRSRPHRRHAALRPARPRRSRRTVRPLHASVPRRLESASTERAHRAPHPERRRGATPGWQLPLRCWS